MRYAVRMSVGMYGEQVAAELRAAAARGRVSTTRLASALQVSPGQMSRKMNGYQPLTVDELAALADALRVPVEQLLPRQREAISDPNPWAPRGSNPQPTVSGVRHLRAVA